MIAIINGETGVLEQVVTSVEGEDLTGKDCHDLPAGWPDDMVWDTETRAFMPAPLEPVRDKAKKAVDALAGCWRATVASEGFGQEMTYLAKEAEARAFAAAQTPDPADYPLLVAEVAITAADIEAVADYVLQAATDWKRKAALIEAARLGAKRQIDAATDRAAIQALVAGLQCPLP